ncbi:uncharacterized protein TRIADDRAFT_61961 [Trichoplax adhaerens]|uniref:AB hydrolase-1 domain-containing protein n=1 Tax=Trichoplax adhaerens TaxID=10228 RepID=B3SCG4_TRIAD|nr:hypothetical protein TRIADDRAFT_61961 [Trichoplax adhaerens]EDV19590.1 hypothetical protein TRIADDRAFT_61961 [Trichoplax adhaerens]|eukprot:XP_002117923.1 hypothetical protein TRIADDRAFT_61961 [Trichoplax adhaerens]
MASNKDQHNNNEFELPTPSDPEVKYTQVSTNNMGITSINNFQAGYTDENPTGFRIVLAVHGTPGSHHDFRYLAPPLVQAGLRVIRVNLPGFGATKKPDELVYNFNTMAHWLANFLSSINIHTVDMAVGHSFGCAIIATLSVTHPELISAFTLLSTFGLRPHRIIRPFAAIKLSAYLLDLSWVTNFIATKILTCAYRMAGFKMSKFVENEMVHSHQLTTNIDFDQHANNLKSIGKRKVPVILAYGKDDPLIENEIFSEVGQILGLKSMTELSDLNGEQGEIHIPMYNIQ